MELLPINNISKRKRNANRKTLIRTSHLFNISKASEKSVSLIFLISYNSIDINNEKLNSYRLINAPIIFYYKKKI